MANSKFVILKSVTNANGQPLANVSVAVLTGDIGGASPAVTTTQPGSPLATIYADPQGNTALTNPTTPGTNTVTTDGLGNLCSSVNGVTTIGVYVADSPAYYVLQIYGPGVLAQQLIPITFPSGGGGGS